MVRIINFLKILYNYKFTIVYYSLICCFCSLSFKYIKDGLGAKKAYIEYKEKQKTTYRFTVINQIENIPIDSKNFYSKINLKVKKTKIKSMSKADMIVRVPLVEHIIEPKKIAEPVQLPEPTVIKIDTSKIKHKIKVTKIN